VLQLQGLEVEPRPANMGVANFDLSVNLSEHTPEGNPSGVLCSVQYRTDLFDRETVEGFAGRLVALLRAVSADPDGRIGGVELLTGVERGRLSEWCHGPVRPGPELSL